jgi:hypothetical protein
MNRNPFLKFLESLLRNFYIQFATKNMKNQIQNQKNAREYNYGLFISYLMNQIIGEG